MDGKHRRKVLPLEENIFEIVHMRPEARGSPPVRDYARLVATLFVLGTTPLLIVLLFAALLVGRATIAEVEEILSEFLPQLLILDGVIVTWLFARRSA